MIVLNMMSVCPAVIIIFIAAERSFFFFVVGLVLHGWAHHRHLLVGWLPGLLWPCSGGIVGLSHRGLGHVRCLLLHLLLHVHVLKLCGQVVLVLGL